MNLYTWAARHGVTLAALAELQELFGMHGTPGDADAAAAGKSEAYAQSQVRLEAAQKGLVLWRNNVGALLDETGRPVRYGLANDSKEVNAVIKSSDLIGIRPVRIEPRHVGLILGQFVGREVKAPGWQYTGTEREVAQLTFAKKVLAMGGDAGFTTGPGSL